MTEDRIPTQEELPGLIDRALDVVKTRLSAGEQGTGIYGSVRAQLQWLDAAVLATVAPDAEKLDSLTIDVIAARELETSDPELSDQLFAISYLAKRRWWTPPDAEDGAP